MSSYVVQAIWRFPVKSMGGESLDAVSLDERGLVGDREWAVYDSEGKLASGKNGSRFKRMDQVFELVATTHGEAVQITLPSGETARAGEGRADAVLSDHFGEEIEVAPEGSVPHQDAGQVSIVGTATLRELGRLNGDADPVDPRSLRANLVVDTDEAFVEESWVGRELQIGCVLLRVVEPIERCRMVSIAQVGVEARSQLLKTISDERSICAAVYADVVRAGAIRRGDVVTPSEG